MADARYRRKGRHSPEDGWMLAIGVAGTWAIVALLVWLAVRVG